MDCNRQLHTVIPSKYHLKQTNKQKKAKAKLSQRNKEQEKTILITEQVKYGMQSWSSPLKTLQYKQKQARG